jgi:hypothetical protein
VLDFDRLESLDKVQRNAEKEDSWIHQFIKKKLVYDESIFAYCRIKRLLNMSKKKIRIID